MSKHIHIHVGKSRDADSIELAGNLESDVIKLANQIGRRAREIRGEVVKAERSGRQSDVAMHIQALRKIREILRQI